MWRVGGGRAAGADVYFLAGLLRREDTAPSSRRPCRLRDHRHDVFRLKQCTFSCVKTRYQKVKMAKIGMRHMTYKSHAPSAT